MKTLKKIIIIVVLLVVVLGIAAVVFVGVFFDDIAKKGIETVAPTITQTPVTVSSVHLGVFSGSASINGFIIGNPSGYTSSNAISLGKAAISLEPKSLFADKIVIHSIEVRAPEITFDGNPLGANNLQKILDNVSGTPNTNTVVNSPETTKKAAKKLQVDDFLISGAKVTAHITGLEGEPFSIVIPDIHFTNLGTGPDGITAAELTQKVIKEISADSLNAVVDHAKSMLGKNAGNLLKGATDSANKALGGNADKVKQGLGNLLGK